MNDEKHTPNEDWEMSVPNTSPPETAIGNNGGWKMPEPVFRVSEGDKVEKTEIRPLAAEHILTDDFEPKDEVFVLEQPNISAEFNTSEIPERFVESEAKSINAENGNVKWIVLLGGIFVFFVVLVGIMLGVYFFFLR